MRKFSVYATALLFGCIIFLPASCFAQSSIAASATITSLNANESSSLVPASPLVADDYSFYSLAAPSLALTPSAPAPPPGVPILSRIGIGVKVSTLGAGIEAAYKIIPHLNIRGGFNDFSYSRTFNTNGFAADASLQLRSVEGHVDYFLIGPLHISGGALFYNDNKATGNLTVPGGSSFKLNSTTYYSDPTNPITGNATLGLNKAAPTATLGLGNLVGKHRVSVNFEVGAAFQGSPSIGMNLAGTACTSYPCVAGVNTINAATDPGLQSNLAAQRKKYSNDLTAFKFYPIISLGFSFRL
ncbi:MAG TPA: hypothetical protein VGR81_05080 [Candidatus Acidoferrales bacterium]|nr:hypothetical protein [Candidatus Acidoferrales bacterium]